MKRIIALLSLIVFVVVSSACTPFKKPPERELMQEAIASPELTAEELLPPVTSTDVELYVAQSDSGELYAVNPYGTPAVGYSFDKAGNIIGRDGRIIVSAENTTQFEKIESLKFSEEEYSVSLDALNLPLECYYSGQYAQYSMPFVISLVIENPSATNQTIVIESSNPEVISVRANQNAQLIPDGSLDVPDSGIALQQKEPSETMSIVINAKSPGDAVLTAKAFSGNAEAKCNIHVEYGAGNMSYVPEEWISDLPYNIAGHVHTFTTDVIQPTLWEKGYTLYTCEDCGYSYKGDYTPQKPGSDTQAEEVHVHQYTVSTVAPTASERGYTLNTCQECGDSYKTNFVGPTG